MKFGFDFPSIFRECFNIMVIYMYLATGQTTPWGIFFYLHTNNYLVILALCCKFSPLNNYVTVFPIQTNRRSNLTLP